MVNDLLKLISDDSTFTEDHIIYLLDTTRSYILKQKYETNAKNQLASSNYQTIHVHLVETEGMYGCCFGGGAQYKSDKKVPELMNIGAVRVYGPNQFRYIFQFVSREQFEFVGHNKWTNKFMYCTIGDDGYLYVKVNKEGCCGQFPTKEVYLTGVFENASDIVDYNCTDTSCKIEGASCNKLENDFPMEEGLLYTLIEIVVTKLAQNIYKPTDPNNNASDDLAKIQQFIVRAMKDRFVKDYQS